MRGGHHLHQLALAEAAENLREIAFEHGGERLLRSPFGMASGERLHAIDHELQLHVDGLLGPERAVVIERCNGSAGGTTPGELGSVARPTKATIARFGAVSLQDGSGSCCASEPGSDALGSTPRPVGGLRVSRDAHGANPRSDLLDFLEAPAQQRSPVTRQRRTSVQAVTLLTSNANGLSAARRSATRARISPLSESRSSITSVASPTDVRYTPPRPNLAESMSGGMFDTTSMMVPTSNSTSGPVP